MYQDLFFHGISAGKYKFDEATDHYGRDVYSGKWIANGCSINKTICRQNQILLHNFVTTHKPPIFQQKLMTYVILRSTKQFLFKIAAAVHIWLRCNLQLKIRILPVRIGGNG